MFARHHLLFSRFARTTYDTSLFLQSVSSACRRSSFDSVSMVCPLLHCLLQFVITLGTDRLFANAEFVDGCHVANNTVDCSRL